MANFEIVLGSVGPSGVGYWPGFPPVGNPKFIQAIGLTTGPGDFTVYIVPPGRKATLGIVQCFNQTLAGITANLRMGIGGISYRMGANVVVGAGALAGLGNSNSFVLEAGQSVIVNATAANLGIFPNIIEYDATAAPRHVRVNVLAAGDNTIYTCPPAKTASILNGSSTGSAFPTVNGSIWISNESGGSLNYNVYAIPNGQVKSANFQIVAQFAVGNLAINNGSCGPPKLAAGDSILVNTSGGAGGESASVNVFEYEI